MQTRLRKNIRQSRLKDFLARLPLPNIYGALGVRGFTLIELMVSVAIFSVVMLIAVGALFSIMDANRKSQALKSSINNLAFALENMSRQIRSGSNYHCGVGALTAAIDCPAGGTQIAFEKYGGSSSNADDQVVYRHAGTRIERSVDGGATYLPITSPEVIVEDLTFYVVGALPEDFPKLQPKVVMTLRGYAGDTERTRTEVKLQTMITSRLLDE